MRREYIFKILLTILLIVIHNPLALAEQPPDKGDWVYFAAGPTGVKHYYEAGSVVKTPENSVKVWIRSVYSGTIRQVKEIDTWTKRYEMDCSGKAYRNFDSILKRTDGTVRSNNKPSRWRKIPPQTMYEYLHEGLCK